MKSLLVVLGLALACLSAAYGAEEYKFALLSPAKAGTVDLPAGNFKVTIQGSVAVIADLGTKKSYTTMVKVENTDQKFGMTSAETSTENGVKKVQAVNIAGGGTRLLFP